MNKTAILVPSLLMLTLAGCTGSGGEEGDDGTGDAGSADANLSGSTACLIDKTWSLDLQDAAQQLATELASKGIDVVSADGEGVQEITFDQEGFAGSNTQVSYTFVANTGGGKTMTMVQTHAGDPGGEWAWLSEDENTVVFSNWEDDRYTVTTETSLDGISAPPHVATSGSYGEGSMTVQCDGDTLVTNAEGSPFTQRWTAEEG